MIWILKHGMFAHAEDGSRLDIDSDEITNQFIAARQEAADDPQRNIFEVRARLERLKSSGTAFWVAKQYLGEGYELYANQNRWALLPDVSSPKAQSKNLILGRLGFFGAAQAYSSLPWAIESYDGLETLENQHFPRLEASVLSDLGSAIAGAEDLMLLESAYHK